MRYKRYEKMLESVNRKIAIRICSAYCTVGTLPILTIAGIPPIKLQVEERVDIYNGEDKKNTKEIIMRKWQEQWNGYNGWTKRFIKDVRKWTQRKYGNINYYLTQIMTGHGSFGTYLKRIGKTDSDQCWYCGQTDTPQHTLFICKEWKGERERAKTALNGVEITEETIAELMIMNKDGWDAIDEMVSKIMRKKIKDARSRK